MKQFSFIALLFASFLTSCFILSYPLRIAGFSIKKFENKDIGRFNENFAMSKKTCFDKSLDIINSLNAKVTHKNFAKGYIITFNFAKNFDCCLDSTEVGIFIKEIENSKVKVEIISNNSSLAKRVSAKFFEKLADASD